jgi:hypothetical protein
MTLLQQTKTGVDTKAYEAFRVELDDGLETTVHVAKYARKAVHPRLQLFETETCLLDWCEQNGTADALVGGFFLRETRKPLGDLWISGVRKPSVSFVSPWHHMRGSLYISPIGGVTIAPRYKLPQRPQSDLLQAGPLLLQNGQLAVTEGADPEGFSEGAAQFDSDITDGRYPRAAIGTNQNYIFSVACDGRRKTEAGLSLQEFSQVLAEIGVIDALNLDGGSSATLIAGGELRNRPRSGVPDARGFDRGRPVFSSIVFEPAS